MKWKPDVSILISLGNEFNTNSHVYSVKWASTKGKHHFKRLTVTVFMNESKGYQKVQRRNLSGAFEIETFVEWKKDSKETSNCDTKQLQIFPCFASFQKSIHVLIMIVDV